MYHELQKQMRFKPFVLLQVSIAIMVTVNVRRNGWSWEGDVQSSTPPELRCDEDIWWHRPASNGSGTVPDVLYTCHRQNQVASSGFAKPFAWFSLRKLRLHMGGVFLSWPCSILPGQASDGGWVRTGNKQWAHREKRPSLLNICRFLLIKPVCSVCCTGR